MRCSLLPHTPPAGEWGWGSRPSPSALRASPRLPSRARASAPSGGGGSLAYGSPPRPPGLIRARRSACGWRALLRTPLRSGARAPPPLVPLGRRAAPGRGAFAPSPPARPPPRPPRLWGRSSAPGAWPPRRAALWGGRGCPPVALWGPWAGSPLRFRPGPPAAAPRSSAVLCGSVARGCACRRLARIPVRAARVPPFRRLPGGAAASVFRGSPLRPPPAAPAGGSGCPRPDWVGFAPRPLRGRPPRGSRFSRPSPASDPGGGGPRGPHFGAVDSPKIVNRTPTHFV